MAYRISLSVTLRLLFCISLIVACLLGIHNAPVFRSQSLTINSTEDSTLSCYHPDAGNIHLIVELMNGATVNQRSNYSDIIYLNCFHSESNTLRYTVTIPSRPGARIFCHALFDDPQESLPILTLTTTSRRTMNVSVGEVAVFQCASCSRIDWRVNNTHLNRLLGTGYSHDINVTTSLAPDGSTRISILHIIGRLIYNNTLIECQAEGASEHLPAVSLFVYQRRCQENVTINSHLILNNNETVEVFLTAHINLDSSYPVYKSIVQLDSLDGLSSSRLEEDASYHEQTLALNLTLPRRRMWNVMYTIIAYCQFTVFELSTHDIQNISVHSPSPGQVIIALDFLQGSTATDILTILYRSSDSHVLYDLAPRISNTRNAVMNVTGVDSGTYDVFVYAVEGNGTYSLATVKPQFIIVDSSTEFPPQHKIEYDIQKTSNGFKVTCNFLDSSISQCVVVVHQKFPILADNHLNVTLYVHRLGSVGNVVSGYILVANPDDFQIAVINGIRKPTNPTDPTLNAQGWIAFVALPCLACLLVVGFIAGCVYKRRRKDQATPKDESPLSLPMEPEGGVPPSLHAAPNGSSQSSQHDPTEGSPHDESPESHTTFKTTTPEQEVSDTVNRRKGGPMPKHSVNRPVEESDSANDSSAFHMYEQLHQEQMDIVGSDSPLVELHTCNIPPKCQGDDIHHKNL